MRFPDSVTRLVVDLRMLSYLQLFHLRSVAADHSEDSAEHLVVGRSVAAARMDFHSSGQTVAAGSVGRSEDSAEHLAVGRSVVADHSEDYDGLLSVVHSEQHS